jgi:hypothetical protein
MQKLIISVSLNKDVYDKLKTMAAESSVSMGDFCGSILRQISENYAAVSVKPWLEREWQGREVKQTTEVLIPDHKGWELKVELPDGEYMLYKNGGAYYSSVENGIMTSGDSPAAGEYQVFLRHEKQ